ncbi:hypothetical protein BDQ12DRAFT_728920 [Crucibulum laeve]|uniref:Frag1/DRAM/Sfk1 family-domain-containing protein n=1 Tax=Crucibulum laeve TaxID=68775 RepID=A0A5C3LGA0_9AGAR|nr:hypothetical protein BDQ12DRAFT_728920 [Crucibulum laeve]
MSPRDHLPRLDGSQLAALILESLLNGYFHVLLIQCLQALYARSKLRQESFFRPMSITAIFLFVMISGHWIVDFLTAFEAFIRPRVPGFCVDPAALTPAEKVYLNLADSKAVLGSAFYVASTLTGDAFMIYRLYIVWARNKFIIIPPIILCIALAVTGSMVTYLFSQAKQPIFAAAGNWITSCFVLTFLCNLYSTSLIAIRIFMSNRQLARVHSHGIGLTKIFEILVESAALYSCCVILSLSTYLAHSNVQFVTVAMTNPIIGIIFCMIVTRAHSSSSNTSVPSTSRRSRTTGSHPLRPMAVKITTEIDGPETMTQDRKSAEFGTPPASPRIYTTQLRSSSSAV